MEGEITLKINYLDDIRRISIATKPSVNDLRNIVKDLYSATPLANQDFSLKWLDDEGDLISLITDREMNEAWNFALRVNSRILRVSVIPLDTKPKATSSPSIPIPIPTPFGNNPLLSSILAKSAEMNINPKKQVEPEQVAKKPIEQQQPPVEVISNPVVITPPPKPPSPPPLPGVKKIVYEEKPASPPSAPSPIRYPLRSVVHHAWCDNCNNRIVGKRFKCTNCPDYDLCEACYPDYLSIHADHKFLEVFLLPHGDLRPAVPTPGCPLIGKGVALLDAGFVSDETLPDGTPVIVSSHFVKIWKMKNRGASRWPDNTRLERVEGDILSSEDSVAVPSAQPGEVVDISVTMFAPSTPGRYTSGWRLTAPNGERFGHKIWVDIVAVPHPEKDVEPVRIGSATITDEPALLTGREAEEEESEDLSPMGLPKKVDDDVEDGPWKDLLVQLYHMGFTDRQKNRELLVRHKGQVLAVIHELLNN